MPITVSLARVNWTLGLIVVALTFLGLVSEVLLSVYQEDWAFGLVPLLNLSYSANIPTWYSSILLLACAGLLGGIAWIKLGQDAPYGRHWTALALILGYLSINELVRIQEVINPALTDTYHLNGLFTLSWVFPFSILVALFALAYLGFLRHLSHRFQVWFGTAGALYVGGALGTELLISLWYGSHGGDNLVYGLLNLAQASFEIVAVTVFLSALLAYISTEIGELRINLRDQAPPERVRRPKKRAAEKSPTNNAAITLKDKLKARYFLRYETR